MLFALSCVAVAAASVTDLWPLAVLAFCLNLAALLSFLLGADGARALYPALVGIGAAVGMLTLLPRADGLLRWLAARFSARALSLIGFPTAIGVRRTPFAVALVVGRSGQAFDVAPECNGFGILLSAVVLAAIYAARRRDAWWRRILLLAVAVVIGLAVNALRIVVIVVLSLRTRLDYALIHEGAGTALYWLALLIIYALAARPWRRQEAS
jgi:exosortase/archaeosortase family protein